MSSDHLLGVQGDKKKRRLKTGKKTHERNVRWSLRTQGRGLCSLTMCKAYTLTMCRRRETDRPGPDCK